jgi:hypothetical protein
VQGVSRGGIPGRGSPGVVNPWGAYESNNNIRGSYPVGSLIITSGGVPNTFFFYNNMPNRYPLCNFDFGFL